MSQRQHIPGVLFAEDFDCPGLPPDQGMEPEPELIGPAYTVADLAAAREQGFRDGHAIAAAQAAADGQAALRASLAAIAHHLEAAQAESAAIAEASADAVARLLLRTLATLFPALCARHGEAEMAAVVRAVLPALSDEPSVTVRASPHDVPGLERELACLDADLAGRVQLMPTAAVDPGGVRISWRHGSAVRDASALWESVAGAMGQAGLLLSEAAGVMEPGHAG